MDILQALNWADWAIIAIVLLSCLIGVKRGFVKEAMSLAVWALAFFVAISFHERLAVLLERSIDTPSLRYVVAFGVLFAATLVVGSLVNYLIGELVKMTGLSGTDRLFGAVFGWVRGVFVVLVAVVLLGGIFEDDPWWRSSRLIPQLLVLEDWARDTTQDVMAWARNLVA